MLNKLRDYNFEIVPAEETTKNTTPDSGQSKKSTVDVGNSEKAV